MKDKTRFNDFKIVKFKDGKFGIRAIMLGGYKFLGFEGINKWYLPCDKREYLFKGTYEQCQERANNYTKEENIMDVGEILPRTAADKKRVLQVWVSLAGVGLVILVGVWAW